MSGAIASVPCASPGNCAAGGNYTTSEYNPDGTGPGQAFVVSQVNGTWHAARQVPAALNLNGPARITAVACPAASRCSAGGCYGDLEISPQQRAFVVSQSR